ncbi:MAG: Uma2 family endonuclease [Pyrinomonadaceae bacterium]
MSTTITKPITAEELLAMPDDGYRYELVKGELIRMPPPPGHKHGLVAMRIAGPLHQYVESNNLGVVYAAETGFKIEEDPDTVRAPDVAFLRRERIEAAGDVKGYWRGAPDLAVEVLSPSDRVTAVEEKVQKWLEAGTRMVWVVSPKLHTITVYRSLSDIVLLTEKDSLDGGEIVPGFRIALAEVFGRG